MEKKDHVWQQEELAKGYLEGVRAAIPLAAEQIDVLLRVICHAGANVERLLDFGCGDGVLGGRVLSAHPAATGVFLDFSEPMIEAARQKAAAQAARAIHVVQDFGTKDWIKAI